MRTRTRSIMWAAGIAALVCVLGAIVLMARARPNTIDASSVTAVTLVTWTNDDLDVVHHLPPSAIPRIQRLIDESSRCLGSKFQVIAHIRIETANAESVSIGLGSNGGFHIDRRYYCTTEARIRALLDDLIPLATPVPSEIEP